MVENPGSGTLRLTDGGRAQARAVDAPLTTEELGGAEALALRAILADHPTPAPKGELAPRLGYSNPRSDGFSEPMARLRALGLIDYRAGAAVAEPVLSLES